MHRILAAQLTNEEPEIVIAEKPAEEGKLSTLHVFVTLKSMSRGID